MKPIQEAVVSEVTPEIPAKRNKSFSLALELADNLKATARELGISENAIVAIALSEYLRNRQTNQQTPAR